MAVNAQWIENSWERTIKYLHASNDHTVYVFRNSFPISLWYANRRSRSREKIIKNSMMRYTYESYSWSREKNNKNIDRIDIRKTCSKHSSIKLISINSQATINERLFSLRLFSKTMIWCAFYTLICIENLLQLNCAGY